MSQRRIKVKATFKKIWMTEDKVKEAYRTGLIAKHNMIACDAKTMYKNGQPIRLIAYRKKNQDEI
jgi:hypothetical protein